MKNKWIAVILTLAMTATLLAGCGNGAAEEETVSEGANEATASSSEDTGEGEPASTEEEDLAEITVSYWPLGALPEEKDLVEDAINEITESEIGVTVHLNIMDVGSYIPNGAMANGVANGEDFDLVLTAAALSGHFSVMSANGMLIPLNDLLDEYGKDLLNTVPEAFIEATTINDNIYAVPSYCNKVQNTYWVCRKSVLEGAGIDITQVTNIQDIEDALVKIKETYPDMNALGGNSSSINLTYPGFSIGAGSNQADYDYLGEATAVAASVYFDDDSMSAVSRYETDQFKADKDVLKKWYDLGLLDKDVATDTATTNTLDDKANVASTFYTGQFDLASSLVKSDEVEYVKIADGSVATGAMLQFTWAIPVSCDEPEAAAKFLNLLYTDERIVNLIDYGVEGTHYEWKEDGTIGFPEGVTTESSGYYMGGITALVGNGFLAHPWEGSDPETAKLAQEEMDHATYSPLLGFALDTANVSDIYAQLCSIANTEYGPALFCGSAPDGYYEEFIDKMYAAGLQEYLDEANKQIQAWLAEK